MHLGFITFYYNSTGSKKFLKFYFNRTLYNIDHSIPCDPLSLVADYILKTCEGRKKNTRIITQIL